MVFFNFYCWNFVSKADGSLIVSRLKLIFRQEFCSQKQLASLDVITFLVVPDINYDDSVEQEHLSFCEESNLFAAFNFSDRNFLRKADSSRILLELCLKFRQEFRSQKLHAVMLFRTSIMMTPSSKSIFLFVKNRICLPLCKKETHSILLAFFGQWTCGDGFFQKYLGNFRLNFQYIFCHYVSLMIFL